ncbi:hypothetical protein N5D11_11700 [Acinetobacter johnsonii]|uniref:Uncharacterized protein n=1 Tax=Acinetobacter johnsonii TaxID=40214 RepID=A0AA42LEA6_ACIJO|nr:hypothetical protein [Acinetobacter johnsonii]MDH0656772.1 hypothetical protein [Acinetobacter johnsonii]
MMLKHCPYCQSTRVHRMFISYPEESQSHLNPQSLFTSAFGLRTQVLKQLCKRPPFSPWLLGLAEILMKGMYLYWIETQRVHSDSGIAIGFYCEQCQRSFNH